jgi:acyl-CoA reductase-like NAD-dependent aldehyde dehydrogenase
LKAGEHSDRWIDVWYSGHDAQQEPRSNVDALLARVEEVVRDPQTGARRARILKRWAERQLARARQRAAGEVSTRMKAISDRKGRDGTD